MDVDDHLAGALQVGVEQAEAALGRRGRQPGLDHDRLAEDAGRLGQRHRRLALQRRAFGQIGVVVGVAELVGQRLHAVGRAVEVEQHPRLAAPHRHAEGAAHLAGPRLGVDPLVVRRPARPVRPAWASSRRTRRAPGRWRRSRGCARRRCRRPARTGPTTAGRRAWPSTPGLGPQVAAEVGHRRVDRLVHGVEGRRVDAVGEQRRLQRVGPAPAPVHDVGLALGAVERGRQRDRHRLPRHQLGVVGGAAAGRDRGRGPGPARR